MTIDAPSPCKTSISWCAFHRSLRVACAFLLALTFIGFSHRVSNASQGHGKQLNPIKIQDGSGETTILKSDALKKMAEPAPESIRVFDEQVMISIPVLLKKYQISEGKILQFQGKENQSVEFPFADVIKGNPPLSIVSTNHGEWKLVNYEPAKSTKEVDKKKGNYFLRSLNGITVSTETAKLQKGKSHCKNTKVYVDLDEALKEAKKVCIFNFSGQNQAKIPAGVFELKNLKELYFGRNQISEISPDIKRLKKLHQLNLGRNQLKTLPPEIGHLKKLETLKLGRNQITSMPREIGNLKKLKKLELDNNLLRVLPPEIGNMKSLRELELANNPIQALPPTLAKLKKLEKVELNGEVFSPEKKKEVENMLPDVEVKWE